MYLKFSPRSSIITILQRNHNGNVIEMIIPGPFYNPGIRDWKYSIPGNTGESRGNLITTGLVYK